MQLAAIRQQVAPPAITDIGYWLLGIVEWNSRCNLLVSSGKLHLLHLSIFDIGYGASTGKEIDEFTNALRLSRAPTS